MKSYRYYDVILALFTASLLISNISATKLVTFGPITMDGGIVLFALVYIFGDVLTEVYGYAYARRAIWTGFAVMLLAVTAFAIVIQLPPAADYQDQAAFEAVLGFLPRIVAASLLAYLAGGFINAYILARLKVITKGEKLWLRLAGSTAVGQVADTAIFALVAFGGILTSLDMLIFIAAGWAYKTGVEILLLPVTYRVVDYLKRQEKVDKYDKKTDFTPTRFSL